MIEELAMYNMASSDTFRSMTVFHYFISSTGIIVMEDNYPYWTTLESFLCVFDFFCRLKTEAVKILKMKPMTLS